MLWTLRVFSKGSTVEGPFGPQQSSQSVRILSPPQASSLLLTFLASPAHAGNPPGSLGSGQAAARDPASCKPSASADSPHSRPRVTTRPTRRLLPFGADPLRLLEAAEKMVNGEVPTCRARTQAIESAGYGPAATGKMSALCGIPLAGSPGETRVDSLDGFASAKRAGRSSLGGRPGTPHPSRGTPVRKHSDRDPASAGNRRHSVNPTRVALPRAASATRKARTAGPTKPG